MPTTEHIHLPLYTDEETPDLSTTGHYNHAMEIIDANVGELEKKDAELAGDIANEREARTSADTALGTRIDNAETEISANSADLTGIKGLTYGNDHVQLVEISNGEYGSPALDEIFEQMGNRALVFKIASNSTRLDAETLAALNSAWPNVLVFGYSEEPSEQAVFYPAFFPELETATAYQFVCYSASNVSTFYQDALPLVTVDRVTGDITTSTRPITVIWGGIEQKPFSTIGLGLKVVSGSLTVDTAEITTGITGNTTWGEIEQP